MRAALNWPTVTLLAGLAFGLAGAMALRASEALAETASNSAGHRIVGEDGAEGRRSISVRLSGRVSEPEIRRLADELIAKRRTANGRIVVRFYLDGMALDQAPWAVATYQSDVKIAISGLKLEEEELFLSELRNDRRQIVGAWLTSPPAVPGRLAIFRENGRVFAEWRLRSGLKTVDELVESRVSRGRRYDVKGENAGYFVVTTAGGLELRDADKLIAVAERIAPEKLAPNGHGSGSSVAQPASMPGAAHTGSPAIVRETLSGTRATADVEDADTMSETPPITAAEPKPQARKRVARPLPTRPVKSADTGPIMRLQGQ